MLQDNRAEEEILAVVEASPTRRWMGIGVLGMLGALVLYVAFATPPELQWQVFLVVVGVAALWAAHRMHQATTHRLELTMTELRSSAGVRLALVEDIEAMDRGVFAFKPSNGFLLRTKTAGGRTWQPGLWWRMGRRIGIGGVAPGSQTKFMSETLSALMAHRG
ncbi:hypothetical protein [Falsiruegeria litorea]|uniref:hypothetical protein n=1 Tax=Falsiruegeria litorea TaxID=1280831 RepID=UPI001BFDDB28|nr:hypothetical protein [Falsiruegeria litorea]